MPKQVVTTLHDVRLPNQRTEYMSYARGCLSPRYNHREKNGSNQSFDFIKDFKSSVKSLCD